MSTSVPSRALLWARFHFGRSFKKPGTLSWVLGVGAVAALIRIAGGSTSAIANLVVLYAVPLAGLSLGTSAMREEIEDQTLTYAFTRPVDRAWLYAARLAAAMGVVACIGAVGSLPSITSAEGAVRTIGAALGSALGYTAFFGLCGALLKRPAPFGLVVAVAWESGLGAVPGYLNQLTLRTHLRNIAELRPTSVLLRNLWDPPHVIVSILVVIAVAIVATAIGALLARRREFVVTR